MSIPQHSHGLSRRTALRWVAGATTTLGLSAATTTAYAEEQNHTAEEQPQPTLVEQFLSQEQFVIAHRGAGDVNPEHSAYAYQQAILKGAQAVEISVRTTADGELVCMHDNALRRTTTEKTGYVSTSTLAEVKRPLIDMRDFLGPNTPLVHITTLEEALGVILATEAGGPYQSVGGSAVLFIEAKDSAGQPKLLELLTARGMQDQVVIKMFRNGKGEFDGNNGFIRYAKEAGFTTWCYFDAHDSFEDIAQLASSDNVDMLGVPFFETVIGRTESSMSDEKISQIINLGKPVIVWETHRRWVQEHFASLGVRGFMSPDPFWLSGRTTSPNLALEQGRRLHGMLPAGQQDVVNLPRWENGELVHQQAYDDSILLGPLAHRTSTADSYVINFTMQWKDALPQTTWQYGYLAFGREDDSAFGIAAKFDTTNSRGGGYIVAIRPGASVIDENGAYVSGDVVQLLRVDAGSAHLTPLVTLRPRTPFVAGEDIRGKIIVRPSNIIIDVAGARSTPIADTTYRGAYVHFGRYQDAAHGGALALSNVVTYKI
ncbi:glycerophosphodiester phosphodiesterase [Rothia sp. P6271]|uniref:glycerophosphodiester phosphodiesterase n=1 Tax=unclassified Rothia (in: high G+C Gram-positive bacteria) TaxID=2689056 RepID=UPI003AD62BDF